MGRTRRRVRKESYRKRYTALSVIEVKYLKDIEEAQIQLLKENQLLPQQDRLPLVQILCILEVMEAKKKAVAEMPDEYVFMRCPPRRYRTIESFAECDCPTKFRFRTHSDLRRVLAALQLPAVCVLPNRSKVSGEELMLIGLRRMAFPSRYCDLIEEFGGDVSLWSRTFKYFIKHVYNKFGSLIVGGMEHWGDYFEDFGKAIKARLIKDGVTHIRRTNAPMRIVAFIDCCIIKTGVAYGGPADDGVGAARHDREIQQAFYTGYKKVHGLKFQDVTLPNGLVADIFGPNSCRRSDAEMLLTSDLDHRVHRLLLEFADRQNDEQRKNMFKEFAIYGDSAYSTLHHVFGCHSGRNLQMILVSML